MGNRKGSWLVLLGVGAGPGGTRGLGVCLKMEPMALLLCVMRDTKSPKSWLLTEPGCVCPLSCMWFMCVLKPVQTWLSP